MTRIFNPPHPGLTLRDDVLPALGLNVTEAAKQLDVSRVALWVLNGRAAISPEMALRIEAWLGVERGGEARLWLAEQSAYDVSQAEQRFKAAPMHVQPAPAMAAWNNANPWRDFRGKSTGPVGATNTAPAPDHNVRVSYIMAKNNVPQEGLTSGDKKQTPAFSDKRDLLIRGNTDRTTRQAGNTRKPQSAATPLVLGFIFVTSRNEFHGWCWWLHGTYCRTAGGIAQVWAKKRKGLLLS